MLNSCMFLCFITFRNDGSGRRDPANYDQQQSYQYNMWWQQNASTSQYNSQQYAYGGGQHDSQATQQVGSRV